MHKCTRHGILRVLFIDLQLYVPSYFTFVLFDTSFKEK